MKLTSLQKLIKFVITTALKISQPKNFVDDNFQFKGSDLVNVA